MSREFRQFQTSMIRPYLSPPKGVLKVMDNLADQLQAMFFDPAGLREARATVERLAEAAQFARTVLNAKGGPLAFERDDATERLDAALNSFGGEV